MNIAKYSMQKWLPLFRAALYVSKKIGHPHDSDKGISETDLLELALAGRIPLTLNIPPAMKDKQGRVLKDGPWDLLVRGQRGKTGKQQVMHQLDRSVSVKGIDGAWVMRKSTGSRAARQLQPKGRGAGELPSAFPEGCALGVRTRALNDLAKNLKGPTPSKAANAFDKPLGARERHTLLKMIIGLAQLAHVDLSHPSSDAFASRIESVTTDLGVRVPERTVRGKLKEADNFLQVVGKPPK
jgi:hypothetical protein